VFVSLVDEHVVHDGVPELVMTRPADCVVGPGGSQMLSDVNLTPREDKTIDFSDQDQTYKAVLYKCPD
jgi:hypothetical protein